MSRPPTPRAGGKLPPVVRAASQAVDHRRPLRGQRRHDEQDEQDVHDVQDEQDYPSASPPPLRSSTLSALRYRWPVARLFWCSLLPRDSLTLIPRGTGVPFKACFDSFRVAVPVSPPPLRCVPPPRRLCRREKVLILHLGRNVVETSKRGFAPPCGSLRWIRPRRRGATCGIHGAAPRSAPLRADPDCAPAAASGE